MVGANKKSKKNYTPKFGKPKQMKATDYHSSSSDEDDEPQQVQRTNGGKAQQQPPQDDNRLSDDSEHNFDDDEEDDVDDGSEFEDDDDNEDEDEDESDEESDAADAGQSTKAAPAKLNQAGSDGETGEEDDDSADADGEDDDDDDDDEESDDNDAAQSGNADWAKSLAKILKQEKPKNKKIVALSKAKKTSDILEAREKAKAIGFAIDGEIKEEKPDAEALEASLQANAAEAEQRRRKRVAFNLRIKPTLMDRERERAFKKIATKGVVQLFNAVRTQQKDLHVQLEKAGRLDHRRDAVLNNINKRKFLDVLMGGKRAKSENVDNDIKMEDEDEVKREDDSDMDDEVYNDGLPKNSIWSVLKEDFLSNKKMSHWDKDEEEDGGAAASGAEDDSD